MNRFFPATRDSNLGPSATRVFSAPVVLGLALFSGGFCLPNSAVAQDVRPSLSSLQAQIDELKTRIQELQALLLLGDFISVQPDAINGLTGPHVIIEGANVHIRSGGGSTADTFSGLGNLVVGYNELPDGFVDGQRAGAHNLIVGPEHGYSSFGGFVAGMTNTVSRPHASVSGGAFNTANGAFSSVSGGGSNTATGPQSSVSGGAANTATGPQSSVSGGAFNRASNTNASVSGGVNNEASGMQATVSGGAERTARGLHDWVGGGLLQND